MTSSPPLAARPRQTGTWICVCAVTAYVLASPFFLRNTPDGSLWVVLWIVLGLSAIGLATLGVVLASRTGREHIEDLHHPDAENADLAPETPALAALAEPRRTVLENLVDRQLPAAIDGTTPPPLPDAGRDDATAALMSRTVTHLSLAGAET